MTTNERCNCTKPTIIDFDYCTKCGLAIGNVKNIRHYSKNHNDSLTEQGQIECLENQIKQHKEDLKQWESWAKYVEKYMGEDEFDEMQTEGRI